MGDASSPGVALRQLTNNSRTSARVIGRVAYTEVAPSSTYRVKEIFGPTIQGEGVHAGRACVFLRFAICNIACSWCDTDFAPEGSVKMTAEQIAHSLVEIDHNQSRVVVVTGGEPTLQWDEDLASTLAEAGFAVHMETNGTRIPAASVDWLTVSPKPQFHSGTIALAPRLSVDECKVVVDDTVDEKILAEYERRYDCEHWLLQPCDEGARSETHRQKAIDLVLRRPQWRLCVQMHKIVEMP